MRIAIDIRNVGKGRTGDEVVFFNLIKSLAVLDHKNEYLLLTDRNPKTDEQLQKSINSMNLSVNFKVVPLREKGANRFLWNSWILSKYLRKNPVDILQVQYITPFFISRKIKIVTIVHDVSFKVFPELIGKTDLFFLNILMPLSLKRADKIIGVSQFTASEIMKYYAIAENKIDWIYNAVADNFTKSISEEQLEAVRKKYNLPQNFILYIGTLQPRKNLPALIEAYVKISIATRKDLKLVLAGGKGHNFDARIDEYIKNYSLQDHVFLPGFIDEADKPALFKLARIFCFPSLYEGFGIPIIEAMTLGIPVLVSNIPSHKEVIGNAALAFDVDNADDFAQKLTQLIANELLRAELIQKGREQIAKFSWLQTAEKMLWIYENIDQKV